MIRTLHIGINNYVGRENDLAGCVNDARDMGELFKRAATSQAYLLDDRATRNNVLTAVTKLLHALGAGDLGVISFSGHGTFLPDKNGDETDGRDEALVCADLQYIVDDEFRGLLEARNPKSRLFVVTDSCFSGTVYRAMPGYHARHRYMPFEKLPGGKRLKRKLPKPSSAPLANVIHFAGCKDNEYSCDAEFGGRPNGAFTYCLLVAAYALGIDSLTYEHWFGELSHRLPTPEYPQTPQCNASKAALRWSVF